MRKFKLSLFCLLSLWCLKPICIISCKCWEDSNYRLSLNVVKFFYWQLHSLVTFLIWVNYPMNFTPFFCFLVLHCGKSIIKVEISAIYNGSVWEEIIKFRVFVSRWLYIFLVRYVIVTWSWWSCRYNGCHVCRVIIHYLCWYWCLMQKCSCPLPKCWTFHVVFLNCF